MTTEKKTTRILTYEGIVCTWEEWVHMVQKQPLSATYRNIFRKKKGKYGLETLNQDSEYSRIVHKLWAIVSGHLDIYFKYLSSKRFL